jgi:hypothetical protein
VNSEQITGHYGKIDIPFDFVGQRTYFIIELSNSHLFEIKVRCNDLFSQDQFGIFRLSVEGAGEPGSCATLSG